MAKAKDVMKDLEKWRIKESDVFSKKVTKASKLASVELQRKSIDVLTDQLISLRTQ